MAKFADNVLELDAEIKKSKFVSYADKVNERFYNSSSNYIDLVTRLKDASDSQAEIIFKELAKEILRRFSQYSSLADMINNKAPDAALVILNDIINTKIYTPSSVDK